MCFFRRIDKSLMAYCNGKDINVPQSGKIDCSTFKFLKEFYPCTHRTIYVNNGTDIMETIMELMVIDDV